jgi:hypothetical protein
MSLDGFINDRNGSVQALYPDLTDWRETEPGKESIENTGAVVMGAMRMRCLKIRTDLQETTSTRCPSSFLRTNPRKSTPKRPTTSSLPSLQMASKALFDRLKLLWGIKK